jgi:hypothetical protein
MNRSNAAFMALIIMTTSVAGCLGESKETIDEVPIGTWFDEEGNMYSFFSNGLGEITHLNDSYWEIDYSASFEVDEFAWERTNDSVSILTNDFFLDEQLILHEDEEYFKLSGSCKKFIYKSDYIRTKENLSARWSEFNAIESAYYNENPNVDECYDSWLRDQAEGNHAKVSMMSAYVGDSDDITFFFRLASGSEYILDEMISWEIYCQRENLSHVDDGNLFGLVNEMANNSPTRIVNSATGYIGHIVPTICIPTQEERDQLYIYTNSGATTYEVLNYGSDVSPGAVIV